MSCFKTKMRYQSRNNNKKVIFGLLGAFLFGLAVLFFGLGQNRLGNFFSPLLNLVSGVQSGAKNIFTASFQEKMDLLEQIEGLKHENERLRLTNMDRMLIHEENKRLKQDLGREVEEGSFILGRVLSKPPVSFFDILTIDIGSDHNIERGDRVYVSDNTEIGFINNVHEHHATVTLYSSASERTPVEMGNGGSLVIAEGQGGGTFTIQAPRTLEIKKGDLLTRPTLSSPIVGVVESAEISEADSFTTVHAKLPINIFEISWVYIRASEE